MPELSPKTKQYHKQRVRSIMVPQPTISIEGVRRHLAHDGLPLDRHYIASLVTQIQIERIKRADTWTLNTALAAVQDVWARFLQASAASAGLYKRASFSDTLSQSEWKLKIPQCGQNGNPGSLAAETNMPYLVNGGADAFRHDTDKVYKLGFGKEKRVSGSNLVPIIEAIKHYEAVLGANAGEQQKALCSILSRSNKWFIKKQSKVKVTKTGQRTGTDTLAKRSRAVNALMKEAATALNGFSAGLGVAMGSYLRNKTKGARSKGSLFGGYANERAAYLIFNKSTSLSGSLIDDYLENTKNKDRNEKSLPAATHKSFKQTYKGKSLDDLTMADWIAINDIARDLEDKQLEVKYMKRHERLKHMLESDGAGGLRFVVGQRSAATPVVNDPVWGPKPGAWPYAMDEWANIYTADDALAQNRDGYAMFNHSTFTAGDDVVCAGTLNIDAGGKLTSIDTNSGHYRPTREHLKVCIEILQDDYHVDFSRTAILLKSPYAEWNPGHLDRFLNGGLPDRG